MVTELVLDTAVASTPSYAHIAHSICWNQVRKKKSLEFLLPLFNLWQSLK